MKRANDIGQHVAKLRRLRGWSQETMAAKIQCLGGKFYEMTRQMIANIESGRANVYHWQIRGIHNVLGCTFDEIFQGPNVNGKDTTPLLKSPRNRRQ